MNDAIRFELIPSITAASVAVTSFLFVLVFLTKKNFRSKAVRSKTGVSIFGFILQSAGYAMVWFLHRPFFTALVPGGLAEAIVCVIASIVGGGSVWIFRSSLLALGREWSLSARLVERHRLVIDGPYRFVRHPIYVAMLGMLFSAWLAFGQANALLVALPVFVAGTFLRIRSEEVLLRAAFGSDWICYRKGVGGFVPLRHRFEKSGQSENQRDTSL